MVVDIALKLGELGIEEDNGVVERLKDARWGRRGQGWYDTGDIITLDAEGFVTIAGRAKRFAKIGGEMVSLSVVEDLATRTWPKSLHACINLPDFQKGEQLVLLTTQRGAARGELAANARAQGIGELNVPKRVFYTKTMPLLGSGKIDYPGVMSLIEQMLPAAEKEVV